MRCDISAAGPWPKNEGGENMNTQDFRLAILHCIISELTNTGRTPLQTIGYFLQEAQGVPTKYTFRMHHYGPYTEALNTDIARLELTG